MKKWMVGVLLLSLFQVVFGASMYQFASVKQEAQFHHLLKELRCLVCQNQDLSDSNAGLAKDLRQQVYDLVNQGQSDQEIIQYLTQRYGDFILFKPPVKPLTWLLWFGPVFFLFCGLLLFRSGVLQRGPVS